MEALNVQSNAASSHGKSYWAGRVISYLCIAFLLFDAITKIMLHPMSVEATEKFGWSVDSVRTIGIVLLVCAVLYIIPRTALFGVMFLTAYFGGAVASMARVGEPFIFPIIFAILIWVSLILRNERLRGLLLN
jgi:hypothetical protein